MRYRDTGEVHKDFHLGTNKTINYILSEYGKDFLNELFKRTAGNVYRDIYENLKKGNSKPLLEHWEYYYTREQGVFEIFEVKDGTCFYVKDCPAVRHLKKRNKDITDNFYLQISMMNDAWSGDTPFIIETDIISEGEYKMTIRRRGNDSQ